ncbi:hypothetical protein [Haloarchaeobius sp. TZWWS8]|uniref:hypothetical protein n=1 Tax=Haloarchaeobius sp. TZWWS8 TaxID=3446121 RepID=UPI003EBB2020
MSKERERHGSTRRVVEAVVLATFDDGAPRTAAEVARETDLPPDTAVEVLEELVADGDLSVKELRAEEVTLDAYFAGTDDGGSGAEPTVSHEEAVDEIVAEMEVPGVSEMMVDWRRDAIRAAWEHLSDADVVTADGFKTEVYPKYRAGYDDPEAWWEFVRPRLPHLPGVSGPGEDGSTWTYVPA